MIKFVVLTYRNGEIESRAANKLDINAFSVAITFGEEIEYFTNVVKVHVSDYFEVMERN